MARATGPLFSVSAEGSIGNALTYTTWKGRATIKAKSIPTNPNTLAQRQARFYIKLLNTLWDTLSAEEKATWSAEALARSMSEFNAFTSENLRRRSANQGILTAIGGGDAPSSAAFDVTQALGSAGVIDAEAVFFTNLEATDIILWSIEPAPGSSNTPASAIEATINETGNAALIHLTNIEPGTYSLTAIKSGTNGSALTSQTVTGIVVT